VLTGNGSRRLSFMNVCGAEPQGVELDASVLVWCVYRFQGEIKDTSAFAHRDPPLAQNASPCPRRIGLLRDV
jgi:hypothetical protein